VSDTVIRKNSQALLIHESPITATIPTKQINVCQQKSTFFAYVLRGGFRGRLHGTLRGAVALPYYQCLLLNLHMEEI